MKKALIILTVITFICSFFLPLSVLAEEGVDNPAEVSVKNGKNEEGTGNYTDVDIQANENNATGDYIDADKNSENEESSDEIADTVAPEDNVN